MQRLHLELGSAHIRINEREDCLVHAEARLDYLEGKRSEDLRKSEAHLSDIVQDIGKGEHLLVRVSEQLEFLENRYQELRDGQRQCQDQLEVQSGVGHQARGRDQGCQTEVECDLQASLYPSASVEPRPGHESTGSFSLCGCRPSPGHRTGQSHRAPTGPGNKILQRSRNSRMVL